MSDKIEDWIQRANDIAMHIAELQARAAMYDTETLHNAWKKQKAALDTHLRTTPEGYRLVPVVPDGLDHVEIFFFLRAGLRASCRSQVVA